MTDETKRKISEAMKGKNKGKTHTEETKRKLSEAMKGHIVTEETKEKMSESLKGQIAWNKGIPCSEETKRKLSEAMKGKNKGKAVSDETKRKISETLKGNIPWNIGIPRDEETKKKISNANKGNANHKGKHHTEETKLKIRESTIKHFEETGFIFPNVGKHETQILDKLESLFGYKIIRQYPVVGYRLDGYIPELNIAIEVDEKFHQDRIKEDNKREDNIKKELGCVFYRIKDY